MNDESLTPVSMTTGKHIHQTAATDARTEVSAAGQP